MPALLPSISKEERQIDELFFKKKKEIDNLFFRSVFIRNTPRVFVAFSLVETFACCLRRRLFQLPLPSLLLLPVRWNECECRSPSSRSSSSPLLVSDLQSALAIGLSLDLHRWPTYKLTFVSNVIFDEAEDNVKNKHCT